MALFKKKEKYVPMRGLMGNAQDYHVYTMKLPDYLIAYAIGLFGGAMVFFIFFRLTVPSIVAGLVCGVFAIGYYREHKLKKRKHNLLVEFKDLLEALTTSYSSGKNTMDAFAESYQDLLDLYGEHADIVKEVRIILAGITNNLILEDLLMDFAKRSDLDDVESFAAIFESCNRQGGNIKEVVWETRKILNDKIEIEMEIKTMITEKENELRIMMVMPLVIMIVLSGMGSITAVANTGINIIAKVVVLGIFFAAYKIGKKIVDIRI